MQVPEIPICFLKKCKNTKIKKNEKFTISDKIKIIYKSNENIRKTNISTYKIRRTLLNKRNKVRLNFYLAYHVNLYEK